MIEKEVKSFKGLTLASARTRGKKRKGQNKDSKG